MYQEKNKKYISGEAYDKRGSNSLLEKYVLDLWQPFLKNKIANLSISNKVVDLGCGTGEYTQAAKNAKKIYAVDVSFVMLKICRQKLKDFNQAEIINVNVKDFKMSQDFADLVIAIGVWEYIVPEELMKTIKMITKNRGRVIVVFPNIYNDLNWMRSFIKMSPCGGSPEGGKQIALKPNYIRKIFKKDFKLLESASFGVVSWIPKKLQFLALPVWKFCDFLWSPFQKLLPLGVNTYYLFERK
mgnify:CR=1 FL=1